MTLRFVVGFADHFPDAYAGSNTQIRDVRGASLHHHACPRSLPFASRPRSQTINNLVEKSPQNWHTTIGLPFRRIEGTTVEWDEIRFDVRLMQRVPYEGVSRMTTSMKRKHRDRYAHDFLWHATRTRQRSSRFAMRSFASRLQYRAPRSRHDEYAHLVCLELAPLHRRL